MILQDNLPGFEFHISKKSREKYKINHSLFSIRGNAIISDFRTARYLSQQINEIRIKEGHTDQLVTAGHINGLGLLHEILHYLIRYYEEKENPGVFQRAVNYLESRLSPEELNTMFLDFIDKFPPLAVYKNEVSPSEYIQGTTGKKPNREIILEEIFLLNIENINPATRTLEELYTEKELSSHTLYQRIIDESESYFKNERPLGSEKLPLFDFLKKPIISNPYSLEGQLNFIRENWAFYIFEIFNIRLLGGRDLIQEDMRLFYKPSGFEKPTPPVPAYEFDKNYFELLKSKLESGEQLTTDESRFYYSEYEKFTFDVDWMPKVVMIAKNVYVWLDQLSRKYRREIKTLDQIPDEELNTLAEWNFNALWLIGIWERSSASRKIKQIMGNSEAAASAYSLFDYVIAADIGGESAFENFKKRAASKGIRLASDMVPNHTGIYSKWVTEKPDYFLQAEHPPYPSYTFNGPNLSDDHRVEVRIEDKYYNHTDAAVIFQRRDSYTGDVKYIYHGNDGTHMPWNDTAQLNLLNPEVREALIQTIMHVARKTPIIRFDAAMTLAKKHYARLWFPQPGTGGAVPSRSDFAMTRDQFDAAMPHEFWREVVDRMNAEMPETLLLAEAFWLMEGYFVRTLGMHRVYNSAFMHMMMKEENEKYRLLIKNTLEFNAEILKRYVNFMSNPDEETAVNQFGKGDKYFGICIMMITLPGLPMFAHGQIEGFSEKYGMEYQKAYYDEYPDGHLIYRHREEIFPLLRKRYLFSQVSNFAFYDYVDNFGNINENVFAFSNMSDGEKTFVVFNNSYTETRGTVNYSFSKPYPGAGFQSLKLATALHLKDDYRTYYKVYEHKSRLQFLISARDITESGIFIPLYGYEYRVYLGFEEIYDNNGDYEKLFRYLDGRGVLSLDETMSELTLAPFHYAFSDLLNEASLDNFKKFIDDRSVKEISKEINERIERTISELSISGKIELNKSDVLGEVYKDFQKIKKYFQISKSGQEYIRTRRLTNLAKTKYPELSEKDLYVLFPQVILYRIFESIAAEEGYNLFDKLLMSRVIFSSLARHMKPEDAGLNVHLIKIVSSIQSNKLKTLLKDASIRSRKSLKAFFEELIEDKEIKVFLNVNEFKKERYFSKERFEYLLYWINLLNLIFIKGSTFTSAKSQKFSPGKDIYSIMTGRMNAIFNKFSALAAESNYRIDELIKCFDVKEIRKNGKKKKIIRKIKKSK